MREIAHALRTQIGLRLGAAGLVAVRQHPAINRRPDGTPIAGPVAVLHDAVSVACHLMDVGMSRLSFLRFSLLVEGSASKGKARPKLCLRKSSRAGARMAGARERPARGCILALGKPSKTLRGAGRLDGAMLERHSEHPRGAGPAF